MSTSGWGYCKRRHRRGPLLAFMGEWWGAGFTKKDTDGLPRWVGEDPEESKVMKPAEGQRMVDCVEENESRTVLGRGNKEQLLMPQVKPVETGLLFGHPPAVVTNSSCCFEEHVFSQKKAEAHKRIFTLSQQQQHVEQRIQPMSSVIPLEIVFCQISLLIIPPKYCCNWHCKSAEAGGDGLSAMRCKICYVTLTTSKCLNCTL